MITRRYDGSRLPELGTVQRHHLAAYICDPNEDSYGLDLEVAEVPSAILRSFSSNGLLFLQCFVEITKCSHRSRPFPETDQRSVKPADAGYKPDANSLNAGTAKRRRAQTSDEAAEAEQRRSQQTAAELGNIYKEGGKDHTEG